MQAKESKHSVLKQELKGNTNRSIEQKSRGKWHQIAPSDFVTRFYSQYHFPVSNYHSHHQSGKAIEDTNKLYCACSQEIGINKAMCFVCRDSSLTMKGAAEAKILESVLKMLKPIKCSDCSEQFSDLNSMDKHVLIYHTNSRITAPNVLVPKRTPAELRNELKKRGKVTSGSKIQLHKRLEELLSTEIWKKPLN